ncbi:hypothetical protein HT102_11185 [Hoyosella sp. G463]|uniref:Secreted protein n=1 Tax=Lolliginicoccus lacisalsi TaxID=2742202 RepID=A0A927PN00_9ACTN|nr:hypothetical protein [Lolliginicoccus lacisalsi]MBD8507051.1 hypothetical protein [Lolliginicoccus lacisalsi]
MNGIKRVLATATCGAALTAAALAAGAGTASAQPVNCNQLPMGVAGLSLCFEGFGEHRLVMDCVREVFPQFGGSSHGFTTVRVEGPWMPVGMPSFATCFGESGWLPIHQQLATETRGPQ